MFAVARNSANNSVLPPADAVFGALDVALGLGGVVLGLARVVLPLAGLCPVLAAAQVADALDDGALGGVEAAGVLAVCACGSAARCEWTRRWQGWTYFGPCSLLKDMMVL